jgi:hypothetical protein
VGQEPVGREPALGEAAELLDVVGLQAVGIAEDADSGGSCARAAGEGSNRGVAGLLESMAGAGPPQ